MKSIKNILAIAILMTPLFFLASCDKDDDINNNIEDEENLEDTTSTVMLEFINTIADHNAVSNEAHVANGDTFDLSLLRYYVSKIKLYDDTGNEIASYPDTYILVKGEEENSFELGELNVGEHVHRIVFNLGIDEATNNQSEDDFTSYPASDPRAIQSPSMHWSWNSGYIFLKLEGTVNSNEVELHLGTDNLRQEVDVTIHGNVEAGKMFHIKLDADIAEFFHDVDTDADVKSMTMDNMPLASKVMGNTSRVFSKAGEHDHGKK